jgi:hypothetical protein
MSLLQNSNAIESGSYNINNSLRFRSSASANLSRTPSGTTRRIMTFSFWVKRGSVSADNYIINATTDATASSVIYFNNSNSGTLDVFLRDTSTNYSLTTTQVFRDPSAWYHIVVAIDTTKATASDRTKVYVNGSEVTSFLTASYIPQNTQLAFGNTVAHYIGGNASYLDGYLAEFYYVSGSQLTPSSFGETDTTTGVWKPKAYTGTYGSNGFYLKFSDIATTSGSNAGLGKDFSGNGNYWTTNNISVTSGSTYDAMIDSPTLSESASNYATLDPNAKASSITLSEGNLKSVDASGSFTVCVFATQTVSNKCYWEFQITNVGVNNARGACGVLPSNYTPTTLANDTLVAGVTALGANSVGMCPQVSAIYQNGATTGISTGVWVANDVVMIAYDNGKLWMGRNGTWANSGNPAAGTGEVASGLDTSALPVICNRNSQTWIANFGQRPFAYTPPTGFVGLNTYNLPDSTIKKGDNYMDITLYQGTATSTAFTNNGSFKPDLVWLKGRSAAKDHSLYDSIRGVTKRLRSSATDAENTVAQGLTAFNSNGFTLGTDNNDNATASTYVAWQWLGSTTATPTYKSVSFIQGATTIAVPMPSTYATNDLLVMVCGSGGTGSTWSTPSGWNTTPSNTNGGACFWKYATASEPSTHSTTITGTNVGSASIFAFSGAAFDTSGVPGTASSTLTPASISVGASNSTILYVVHDNGASRSSSTPTGYTSRVSDTDSTAPSMQIYSLDGVASGTYTPPSVTTTGGTMRGFLISIKPSSAVLNTTGSITSTVSANTTAGFSIVTYTGDGVSSSTVGHGLGVAPAMIIVKSRSVIKDWYVYHKSSTANTYLQLDTTIAATTVPSGGMISTSPTSTTFGFTAGASVNNVNQSAVTYVAYCWSEIAGFSKFGSYTGNGNANGPFVYLGFRPKFILLKNTTTAATNWKMIDSTRSTYNVTNLELRAESSAAEVTGSSTSDVYCDLLSNGFKLRGTGSSINNTGTIIYAAFAENPFKNSLAR